jgi:hypothetical protein
MLVTIGAAYWAYLLKYGTVSPSPVLHTIPTPQPTPNDPTRKQDTRVIITDIGKAVGVEVKRPDGAGGFVRAHSVIIPDAAPTGKMFKRTFATTEDDMTEIPINLYEGKSENLDECTPLMTFTITGLSPGRPAGQLVEVEIGYTSDVVIRGTARDVAERRTVDIVIDRTARPSGNQER